MGQVLHRDTTARRDGSAELQTHQTGMSRVRAFIDNMTTFQRFSAATVLGLAAVGSAAYGFTRVKLGEPNLGSATPSYSAKMPNGNLAVGAGLDFSKSRTGLSREIYEAVAAKIDNPQQIFAAAGLEPLWTATPAEAQGRLPVNCKPVPEKARVWESWFRGDLTNNGRVLSTAELLLVNDNVATAVLQDSRTKFTPLSPEERVKRIDQVRLETLEELGITSPSKALEAMTIAGASWSAAKHRRFYRDSKGDMYDLYITQKNRWPTASEYSQNNLGQICMMSVPDMIYIARGMEKLHGTGLKVGGVSGVAYNKSGSQIGHSLVVAEIPVSGGRTGSVYYDPTAALKTPDENWSIGTVIYRIAANGGPGQGGALDQYAIEKLASEYLMCVPPNDSEKMGSTMEYPDAMYPLGENWGPKTGGLGNYSPYPVQSWDSVSGPKMAQMVRDPALGGLPFDNYRKQHRDELTKLETGARTVVRW